MRIGSMVYLLPFYHPIRLIEEITMLREQLQAYAALGIDLVVLGFDWGDLDAIEVRNSLDLVAEHVMPDFETQNTQR